MSELEIQVGERPGGGRLLTLRGPLTLNTLFEFMAVLRQDHTDLIIDLSAVPFMDSAGLGAILGGFASCQRNGHRFALVNTPQRVMTLLQVSRVDTLLPLFASLEAAEAQAAAQ
ncbi:MAG TPA: STAS domain-containing protein [Bryobacteraceae bacterium]|nr:STAS domain-containing protein [Bryobacteraceae bacterium]